MITRTTKFISAAVVAMALVATVAIARTQQVQTPAVHQVTTGSAVQTQADHRANGTMRVPRMQTTQPQPHTNFSCAAAIAQDCQKLDWWPE